VGDFDGLVLMGGPMSVNDEARHAWLIAEKRLIEATFQESRRILGVCLGSQILAAALGCRVHRAVAPEIGWLPVRRTPGATRSRTFAEIPPLFTPLHWHGETFSLPQGALHLAATDLVPHQAFEIEFDGGPERGGAMALALQFHLEATAESVREMAAAEFAAAPEAIRRTFPPEAELLATPSRYSAVRPLLNEVLDRLFGPAESQDSRNHP
jgi:GMP synthase (glutamine-hydrolysing)